MPERTGLWIPILELLETPSSSGGLRLVFGNLLVDPDVKLEQMTNRVGLQLLGITPAVVGFEQMSELRAPVTQVVDADWLVAQCGVYSV